MQATIRKWIRTRKCYVQAIPAEIVEVIRAKDGSAPTRLIVRDERTGRQSTWVNYWHRVMQRAVGDGIEPGWVVNGYLPDGSGWAPRGHKKLAKLSIHMRGPGFEDVDNAGEGAGGPYGYAYGPHPPVAMSTGGMKGVILCGPPSGWTPEARDDDQALGIVTRTRDGRRSFPRHDLGGGGIRTPLHAFPGREPGVTVTPARTIEEAQAQVRAQLEDREDNFGIHGGLKPSTVAALRDPPLNDMHAAAIREDPNKANLGRSKRGPIGETFVSAGYPGYLLDIGHKEASPQRDPRDVLDPNRPTMRRVRELYSAWMDAWRAAGYPKLEGRGNHLHVVLDDGNTDRKLVAECLKDWRAHWCTGEVDGALNSIARELADAVEAASVRQLRGQRRVAPRPNGHQAGARR